MCRAPTAGSSRRRAAVTLAGTCRVVLARPPRRANPSNPRRSRRFRGGGWGNRRWNSSASGAAPGQAEEVRSLNAGGVEQGEEAAGVVLHREVFGRVTGLSASRSVPRYDVEVTAEIVDLCPPDATISDESVQEDKRRPGSAAAIGDTEAVGGGEGVHLLDQRMSASPAAPRARWRRASSDGSRRYGAVALAALLSFAGRRGSVRLSAVTASPTTD